MGMITNPAIDVLQRELEETNRHISEMTEALKAAKAKHKSLEDALTLLTGQPALSHTSRSTGESGPTLKDQILDLLATDRMGLAPAEIARLLTEKGRETGNTTVSSTLSRMKKEGVVVKHGGKWFLPQGNTSQGGNSVGLPGMNDVMPVPTTPSSDWAHKVSQDLSSPQPNPASAGAGEAKSESAAGTFAFQNPNLDPRGQ